MKRTFALIRATTAADFKATQEKLRTFERSAQLAYAEEVEFRKNFDCTDGICSLVQYIKVPSASEAEAVDIATELGLFGCGLGFYNEKGTLACDNERGDVVPRPFSYLISSMQGKRTVSEFLRTRTIPAF